MNESETGGPQPRIHDQPQSRQTMLPERPRENDWLNQFYTKTTRRATTDATILPLPIDGSQS